MNKAPILFLTDPWDTLDHKFDTSIAIMNALVQLGIPVYWSTIELLLRNNQVCRFFYNRLGPLKRAPSPISFFQQIHYRLDPPIDENYRWGLEQLDQIAPRLMVNPAKPLLEKSEKLIACEILGASPSFLISKKIPLLLQTMQKWKKAVYKPLFGAQSIGVEILEAKSKTLSRTLSRLTHHETSSVLIQKFLPEISEGEIRLWFVNSRLLASVKKIPAARTSIINMDSGGTLSKVSNLELRKVYPLQTKIQRWLKTHHIKLAAVDVIGKYITDFNITSPGLIVQMQELLKTQLAEEIAYELMNRKNN